MTAYIKHTFIVKYYMHTLHMHTYVHTCVYDYIYMLYMSRTKISHIYILYILF